MEEVLERFRTIEFHDDFDMIVAIANGGIVPAVSSTSDCKKKCICYVSICGMNTNIRSTMHPSCLLRLTLILKIKASYW